MLVYQRVDDFTEFYHRQTHHFAVKHRGRLGLFRTKKTIPKFGSSTFRRLNRDVKNISYTPVNLDICVDTVNPTFKCCRSL